MFFIFTESQQAPSVSTSAIIGTSVSIVCVLCVVMVATCICLYHKRKQTRRAQPNQPSTTGGELPPGLSYHLPREALLREPPPRYTSTDNLAIVNPSYRDDDGDLPPPYYSANVGHRTHTPYGGLQPPPSYCSRTDLRDHQLTEDDGPAAYSRYSGGEPPHSLAVISSGVIVPPVGNTTGSNLSHSNAESFIVDTHSSVAGLPTASRCHGVISRDGAVKQNNKDIVSASLHKDISGSLDDSKSSLVEGKPQSYSLYVSEEMGSEGKLTDASIREANLKDKKTGAIQTNKGKKSKNKSETKNKPKLGERDDVVNQVSPGEGAQCTTECSTDSIPCIQTDQRIPHAPDLAMWGAQILACSSRQHLEGSSYSIQTSCADDTLNALQATEAAAAVHRRLSVSSDNYMSDEDAARHQSYNGTALVTKTDTITKNHDSHVNMRPSERAAAHYQNSGNTEGDVKMSSSIRDMRRLGIQKTEANKQPAGTLQKSHSLPQLSYTAGQNFHLQFSAEIENNEGIEC